MGRALAKISRRGTPILRVMTDHFMTYQAFADESEARQSRTICTPLS